MRGAVLLIFIPIWVAVAWLAYAGAKWVAAMIFSSSIDQAIAAALAVIVAMGLFAAVMIDMERNP